MAAQKLSSWGKCSNKPIFSRKKINLLCTYLNSWLKSLLCLIADLQQKLLPLFPSLPVSRWIPIDRAYSYSLRNHIKLDIAKKLASKRCLRVLSFKSNFNRQLWAEGSFFLTWSLSKIHKLALACRWSYWQISTTHLRKSRVQTYDLLNFSFFLS